ncbi:hypothetical protein [Novosphingobium naphthalenivorans]|uniref:hypothetical protein n=1 Tax=Novosphingobium naphthalenivorans TaxID=273168 RepID=UPI000AB5FFCB|nr:hypothetical protein [Novosphingobium naphthalenivorans]
MSFGGNFLRVGVVLVGGVLALWISIGVTLNFTIAERYPDLVHEWWPDGVTPTVVSAGRVLSSPSPSAASVVQTRASLRAAALREPVSSYALGMLGAVADFQEDEAQAQAFFQSSEAMSRRNLLTEMWLIEDAVSHGDVSEALSHYNRAMLVSTKSRKTLLPILVSATSEPDVLANLLPMLAQKPLWWKAYVNEMGASGKDPAVMSAAVLALKLDLSDPEQKSLIERVLNRMIALNDEKGALQTANDLEGRTEAYRTIQDGEFDQAPGLLPFAWWLSQDSNIQAYRGKVPGGGEGLWLETHDDTGGGIARQLIGLEPGHYLFSGIFGDQTSDAVNHLAIELSCRQGGRLRNFNLPSTKEIRQSFRFEFDVPLSSCHTQWVKFRSVLGGDNKVWIDKINIKKISQ